MNKIISNTRKSPWDNQEGMTEIKDSATPTYNGIRAGITPYTERRKLNYGSVQEVNSTLRNGS